MPVIYVLKCPDSGEIRYIGKADDARERMVRHLSDSHRRDTPVYRWIRKLVRVNKLPQMVVVFDVPVGESWQVHETGFIAAAKEAGYRLLNVAEGGDAIPCSKTLRASNGKRAARLVHDNPLRKKVWKLKHFAAANMLFFKRKGRKDLYNHFVERGYQLGLACPDLFGDYLTVEKI